MPNEKNRKASPRGQQELRAPKIAIRRTPVAKNGKIGVLRRNGYGNWALNSLAVEVREKQK